jgi:hypothetical protein
MSKSFFDSIQKIFRPQPMTIERWADRCSRITTPDEILAAGFIESFSRIEEYKDWRLIHSGGNRLTNSKKNIELSYYRNHNYDSNYNTYYTYSNFKINDVPIDDNLGERIIKSFEKVKAQHDAVKAKAKKAKAEMERNEKAWNLVESMLGMKRNEHGALVPVKTAEGDDAVYS